MDIQTERIKELWILIFIPHNTEANEYHKLWFMLKKNIES